MIGKIWSRREFINKLCIWLTNLLGGSVFISFWQCFVNLTQNLLNLLVTGLKWVSRPNLFFERGTISNRKHEISGFTLKRTWNGVQQSWNWWNKYSVSVMKVYMYIVLVSPWVEVFQHRLWWQMSVKLECMRRF